MKAARYHCAGGSCACVAAIGLAWATNVAMSAGAQYRVGQPSHQLSLNTNGALRSWPGELESVEGARNGTAGVVRYRDQTLPLSAPEVTRRGAGLTLTYRWPSEPGLEVTIRHQFKTEGGASCWTRAVRVQPPKLVSNLTVSLESWPQSLPRDTWLPMLNGTGAALGTNGAAAYHFAGALPGDGARLALPMVSVPKGQGHRWLLATDPYFSSRFTARALAWTYLAKAGIPEDERTIVVALHPGGIEESLGWFFRAALPGVAPGPAWLHDIALVDFDYLSDGGRGWFRDLDALSAVLPRRERKQALFCLHGWYDFLGRYCFDAHTGKLDREWTAFSSYELARKAPAWGTIGGTRVEVGFGNCRPVKMSLASVHERLRYSRRRGFRVALYFADGLNAGEGLPDFEPTRVLQWGGWQGPDSQGRSYLQNPLHPKVRAFYLAYAQALLAEFGLEIDALVWDETFHVPCGKLGTDAYPGYADRAMMQLVRQITQLVEDYNRGQRRQIAFLTSDCQGAFGDQLIGPYALVSHGTFQDSWCQPRAWSYGLFANYRNVLWSCCWWPVSKWSWVEFGVREYQAPVSISDGWGNDKGFSEFSPAQQDEVLNLFNWRKQRPTRLHWFVELPKEAAK